MERRPKWHVRKQAFRNNKKIDNLTSLKSFFMKPNKNSIFYLFMSAAFLFSLSSCIKDNVIKTDVLIIGGGASGISAGIQSSRLNAETVIIEESTWLGGMLTAAGVSAVDGNYQLPSGIWGEFKDSLTNYYRTPEALKTGWVSNVLFEPSVGDKIFKNIAAKEKKLKVYYNSTLSSLKKKNDKWFAEVNTPNGTLTFSAKIVIDATELGDVAKLCGVGYDIGMESRKETGEPGAPEEANDIIQDLTYVATLKDYGRDVTIERPIDYDSTLYLCCCINKYCSNPPQPWSTQTMITYGKLPNDKYMINWPMNGNDCYLNIIEMSTEERIEALKKAKNITMGFIYFMQKELGFNNLGLANDEYPTEDLLPFIPYHRESRRIHGLVRFTENYIREPYSQKYKLYRTNIAVGDYPIDHHHKRYNGQVPLPDLSFYPIPSYGLPLGTLIPKDIPGLIVAEKSISVSNIVNGTTRLQPVVLQIGQAAGALAALAVKQNKKINEVEVRDVQNTILNYGGYLMPYLDVEKNDSLFLPLQRIGATGILKGEGKSKGWANETWFRVNDILLYSELEGLKEVYPDIEINSISSPVILKDALQIIDNIAQKENIIIKEGIEKASKQIYSKYHFTPFDFNKQITRGEMAVLIDQLLDPFNKKKVDIYGNFKN